ncbi:MAG: phospholipid carrier-dependent glycosyltransferase [Calditrichaeota bacterium]|nr:phospholipid carrier-dependent glycosyltransferase [Calditrichota bacterium]
MISSLRLLFLLAFVLRLALAALISSETTKSSLPQYNDEPLHFEYVKHIAEHRAIPVYNPTFGGAGNPTAEFVQPPLYYILAAQVFRWSRFLWQGSELYATRFLSILFGLLAGMAALRIARLSGLKENESLLTTACMLFFPNAVVFTSIVSNDALLIALSAMFVASLLSGRASGAGWRRVMMTGVMLGLAVLTKLSALLLLPLVWFVAPPGLRRGEAWLRRGVALCIAAVMILPLLAWNWSQYDRLVPLASGYSPAEVTQWTNGAIYHPWAALKYCLRSAVVPFDALWGSIPAKSITVVWLIVWLGFMLVGLYFWRREGLNNLVLILLVLVLAGFLAHNVKLFQVEFRLLAPAFTGFAMLTALGASRLIRLKSPPMALFLAAPVLALPFL